MKESSEVLNRNYATTTGFYLIATLYFIVAFMDVDRTSDFIDPLFANNIVANITSLALLLVGITLLLLKKRHLVAMTFLIIGGVFFFIGNINNIIIAIIFNAFLIIFAAVILISKDKVKYILAIVVGLIGMRGIAVQLTPPMLDTIFSLIVGFVALYFAFASISGRLHLPCHKILTKDNNTNPKENITALGYLSFAISATVWGTVYFFEVPFESAIVIDALSGILLILISVILFLVYKKNFEATVFFLMGFLTYIIHLEIGLPIIIEGVMYIVLSIFAFLKKQPNILVGIMLLLYGTTFFITSIISGSAVLPAVSGMLNFMVAGIALYLAFASINGDKILIFNHSHALRNLLPHISKDSSDAINLTDRKNIFKRWGAWLFIAVFFTTFTIHFFDYMVTVALPSIGETFDLPVYDIALVKTAYSLANIIFLIPGVYIANKLGYKRTFILGCAIVIISALLTIIVPNYVAFLIIRFASGVGASLISITAIVILMHVLPDETHGLIITSSVISSFAGFMLGYIIGGVLIDAIGWQIPYVMEMLVCTLSIILLHGILKTNTSFKVGKFDITGCILYVISIAMFFYGVTTIVNIESKIMAGVGFCLFVIFVIQELKKTNPLLNIRLFLNNRRFSMTTIVAFLYYFISELITYMMSLYLQYIGEISAAECGLILMFQPLTMLICTLFVSRLSKKVDKKRLVTIGMFIITASTMLLLTSTIISSDYLYQVIVASTFLTGIGGAMFSMPNTDIGMHSVDEKDYAMAKSTDTLTRNIGKLSSLVVSSTIIALIIGSNVVFSPEVYGGFVAVLLVSMIICTLFGVASIFVSEFRGKAKVRN